MRIVLTTLDVLAVLLNGGFMYFYTLRRRRFLSNKAKAEAIKDLDEIFYPDLFWQRMWSVGLILALSFFCLFFLVWTVGAINLDLQLFKVIAVTLGIETMVALFCFTFGWSVG